MAGRGPRGAGAFHSRPGPRRRGRAARGARVKAGSPQALGRQDRDAEGRSPLSHRGGGQLRAPSGRPRRRGHHRHQEQLGGRGHGREDGHGKGAGPEEDRPGAVHVSRAWPPSPSRGRSRAALGARRRRRLVLVVVAAADRDQLVGGSQVVDVELALQVVELVLQGTPEQARAADLVLAAGAVLGDDPDMLAARDVGDKAGNGEAALQVAVVALGPHDAGVDELEEPVPHLDDGDVEGLAELRRREADAGRVAHGVGQVVEEVSQQLAEALDRLALEAQPGIAEREDREDAHAPSIEDGTRPSVRRSGLRSGGRRGVGGWCARRRVGCIRRVGRRGAPSAPRCRTSSAKRRERSATWSRHPP